MTDLISRQAAVSRISDLLMLELKGERIPTWNEVYRAIQELPSAEKNGRWDCGTGLCVCSNCGKSPHYVYVPAEDWNFCPNCGARMERSEE